MGVASGAFEVSGPGGLRRDDVDGVPAFWMAGRGDVLRASLWFRCGMSDLPLARHGWAHLLEHMALHGEDVMRRPVNGQVSLLHMAFHVQGESNEVGAFLTDLCSWLAVPDLRSLEHECRVLRAEGDQRPKSTMSRHLLWRYGASGPGLAGYDEFGLHTADTQSLAELAGHVFVRGNAALSLNGPPPSGLTLSLPDGPRWPTHAAVPCEQQYPAGFDDPVPGIGMSGTMPRSVAATAFGRLLERSVHRQFRNREGVGYSAWSGYEAVDATTAVVAVGIDVLADSRGQIVDQARQLLDQIADGDLPEQDVADDAHNTLLAMRAQPEAEWAPWIAARDELLGVQPTNPSELVAQIQGVTVEDVTACATSMGRSLLVGVDHGVPRGSGLPWLDVAPACLPRGIATADAEGRTFRNLDYPINKTLLTVSSRHAALATPRTVLAVGRADIAAGLAWPDGARALIRQDGYQVRIEPTLWRDGATAIALIDELVPAAAVIKLSDRNPDDVPHPTTRKWQRLLAHLDWLRRRWLLVVLLAALLTNTVLYGGNAGAPLTVLALALLLRIAIQKLRARRHVPSKPTDQSRAARPKVRR